MYRRSLNSLMGTGEVAARVSKSCGVLNKSEVTSPRALDAEANVSSPSAFEAWLTTYRKRLEESCRGPILVDRGVTSFFG